MASKLIHVALLPTLLRREGLERSAVCVVDLLRASTTMVRAIEAGAAALRLVAEPAEALRQRDALGAGAAVAAGERGGVAPAGFDLGNSPAEFTSERISGKSVVFTTTNGTRVVMAAKDAALVVIGCLQNRQAVAERLAQHDGPVTIACAGTDGRIAMEDALAAGAIVAALVERDAQMELSDPARVCLWAWRGASVDAATLGAAVGESAGAKNLVKVGLGRDVAECVRTDVSTVVPRWNGEAVVA